jgi:hypothetical protein
MIQPRGGRGHKVPYEQTHVRVPLPVLDKVKRIIDRYRASVIEDSASGELDAPSCDDIEICIKLVNKFLEDANISEESINKPTRNNQNLRRFVDWLEGMK